MEAIFGGIKVDVNFAGNFRVFPHKNCALSYVADGIQGCLHPRWFAGFLPPTVWVGWWKGLENSFQGDFRTAEGSDFTVSMKKPKVS